MLLLLLDLIANSFIDSLKPAYVGITKESDKFPFKKKSEWHLGSESHGREYIKNGISLTNLSDVVSPFPGQQQSSGQTRPLVKANISLKTSFKRNEKKFDFLLQILMCEI